MEDTAAAIGITINPRKCVSLHIHNNHQETIPTEFKINNITTINALDDLNVTKYLGKPFRYHVNPDSDQLQDYIDTGKEILKSSFTPWQKIDALKTFVYPSFMFSMHMNMFLKTQWRELDTQLCPPIKKELNLSRNNCTEYLYGDIADGLFGIPVSADDSDIPKLDTAFKLLTFLISSLQT